MIYFENNQDKMHFDESLKNLIINSISQTLKSEGFNHEFEINVYIVDNNEIKEINNEFRNINRETDVLSFPMIDFKLRNKYEVFEDDKNPESGCVLLGDMILSLEKAMEQSIEYGHTFEREIAFLTVHSTLHLLGYDHEDEGERKVMREKEEDILNNLGLVR
ncbi:Endoribonuclease YbeY [Caloramator mitchellensis]|uniref:Endoribonuclease YbeY n=1 Tax=Caloramator mitchellensis TaxID=908809 RepID=A0A0R3JT10_CALMK|nr:rRNA maturation RNase YbeY [Caloramator mitchellensis]KRQ86649.1 Endoribonuclease YbeY [Caloramator mitchellensis]